MTIISRKDIPQPFIFIHIPKTGGSSIEHILQSSGSVEKTYSHKGIRYILQILKQHKDDIKNYCVFTFVRNPWEKILSSFYFLKTYRKKVYDDKYDFTNYIKNVICVKKSRNIDKIHQIRFLTHNNQENGNVIVPNIYRFENLQQDWKIIQNKLSLITKMNLSHKFKTLHKHYSTYYTEKTKNLISERFKKDIELFSYTFEDKR